MSEFLEQLPPSIHIIDAARRRTSGRVLDVGCGLGQDSLFLAQRGYTVDALDVSKKALEIVAFRAAKLGVDISLLHEDIATYEPEHQYDIIMADRSLYFLPSYDAFKSAVLKLQEATVIGGIHTNTILSEENTIDPGPRLQMGRYSMINLYTLGKQWEERHTWWLTDPLGMKTVTLTAQKVN